MPKIIHFENDRFLAGIYKAVFKRDGFECISYANPTKNPVKLVLKHHPDLIIMNIIMPVLDGFVATGLLKTDARTRNIPILGLSNLGRPADIKKGKDLGMVGYLIMAKYKPSAVVDEVRKILHTLNP